MAFVSVVEMYLCHHVSIFGFTRLLPESLPWLISQKRWQKALTTVKQIARINGKDAGEFIHLLPAHCDSEDTSADSLVVQKRVEGNVETRANAATELDTMVGISPIDNGSAEARRHTDSEKGCKDEDGAEDIDRVRGMHCEGDTTLVDYSHGACNGTVKAAVSYTHLTLPTTASV